MATNKATVIYRVQFASTKIGWWNEIDKTYHNLKEARRALKCAVATAKTKLEGGHKYSRFWRVVKYQFNPMEVVENVEIKEKTNG